MILIGLQLLTDGLDAGAVDVDIYSVLKTQHFNQSESGAPALPPTNGFSFQSVVAFSATNAVTSATVRTPFNQVHTLVPEGDLALRWEERFDSLGAMNSFHPPGTLFGQIYVMTMNTTNDGVQSENLTYIFGPDYPLTPHVLNWPEAQGIDHTVDFTLQWNDLGGDVQNPAGVSIQEQNGNLVYSTPAPFTTNALNGTSNSVVIPAYTLGPGTTYVADLSLAQIGGPPNTNYAIGAAVLAKTTRFSLNTRPAPPAPILELIPQPNGEMNVVLTGETNRTYQFLSTTNGTIWQSLLLTNSASGHVEYVDTNAPTTQRRFYRGQVGQ